MSSNIIDYVRVGQKTNRQDINKILAELQDINAQEPEDAALQERIALWSGRRKRTSSTKRAGAVDESLSFTRDRRTEEVTMEIPTSCTSFPFTATDTGIITFDASSGESKFGGHGDFETGLNYISIANIVSSDLDIAKANAFTLFGFIKRSANSKIEHLITKSNNAAATSNGYKSFIQADGTIRFSLSDGTTALTVDSSTAIDDNIYHSFGCTYSGIGNQSGMKVYIDGSLETTGTSATLAGDITNTRSLFIGNADDDLEDFEGVGAWFILLREEVNATWMTNANNGHFDFSGGNLVFYIPFTGETTVFGEATTNYCVSS